MSIELTINGQVFDYPETGDEEWGPDATDWATAVSSGLLQKTGGLFQLLAEVDFGSNFGIKARWFKSKTIKAATTGTLRLARVDTFGWRNEANTDDLLFSVNDLDQLLFNGNPLIGFLTPFDTDSIDMDITAGLVSANLNLSADPADANTQLVDLTIETDGLKAQITDAAIFAALPNASAIQTGLLTSADWVTFNAKQAAGNYITALTGDATAAGPGSVPITLANVNGNVGSFLGTNLTVNAKGLITAASNSKSESYNLLNLGLSTSIGSNLLTVNLKQADGSTDPAAGTGTVRIGFRSSTLTSGAYNLRTVTSALSVNTIATGATFGLVSGQPQYIYVYALDNAGTVELALAGNAIFDEGVLQSTTAIGAASTSSQVLYSTTARSNVAVRLIGRGLSNQVTSGTYASAVSQLTLIPFDKTNLRSYVIFDTGINHGSAGTSTIRWTNVSTVGTALTAVQSATAGDSITVNEDGLYSVLHYNVFTGGNQFGVTLNGVAATQIQANTTASIICMATTSPANWGCTSGVTFAAAGSIFRAQDQAASMVTPQPSKFVVVKIGN